MANMNTATAIPTQEDRSLGLVKIMTPDQVTSWSKAQEDRGKAAQEQQKAPLIGLAANLNTKWQAAQTAKTMNIERRLLQSHRQRKGEYDPDKLAYINKFGGSDVYMMLTNVKCRAAESWARDILIPPGEKPWGIDSTPVPNIPEAEEVKIVEQVTLEASSLMTDQGLEAVTPAQISDRLTEMRESVQKEKIEKAKKVAKSNEKHIEDDLREGKYYEALSFFISDLCTFPAAFLKGPVIRRHKTLVWTDDQDGNLVPAIEVEPRREWCRASPYDIFPSPGAKSVQDGYLFERHKLRRSDLLAMIGVPGYRTEAIRAVLEEHGRGGLRQWLYVDQSRADIEDRHTEWDDPDPPIEALEFWGTLQGRDLIEWGMSSKEIPDVLQEYQVTAWMVGRWIIMARLNPNPLGRRPYYSAAFEEVADSVWGRCPAELMRDIQDVCNGVARAIVNNLSIASGPQVEVNMDRVDPGEDVESVYPWKVWKVKSDPNGGTQHAIQFYQPSPFTEMLIKVYEYFFQQASEQTGIPSYIYGQQNVPGGAGKTASGLSMLMNAASKTLKDVISHIDSNIIKPSIYDLWVHKMLFDDDLIKTGDINIIARASEYLVIAEQLQLRRTEFLQATANEFDMDIIGKKGRATILREQAKSLKMGAEDIVPSKQDMEDRERMEQAQMAAMAQAQAQEAAVAGPGAIPMPREQAPGGGRSGEMMRLAA